VSDQREMFRPDDGEIGRQAAVVLEFLRSAEGRARGLTSLDALGRWGFARLAAVVCDLRKAGHDIQTQRVRVECVHGGRAANVARYWYGPPPAEAS
jgi:hypothetical protein